jgi:hypothetical protein
MLFDNRDKHCLMVSAEQKNIDQLYTCQIDNEDKDAWK